VLCDGGGQHYSKVFTVILATNTPGHCAAAGDHSPKPRLEGCRERGAKRYVPELQRRVRGFHAS